MDADERKTALGNIESVVPDIVFNRLINILTMIEGYKNDAIVTALSKASTNSTYSFTYFMNTKAHEESITPIREILDLCEGWFITSETIVGINGRVHLKVKSIIGKELPK